ncbi:MAG: MBL fold metallo-hydrolase [Spirochaetes bacterium]|nr:MBL fold metallo-hydrolase [Spirochaetota bacterium]
MTIRFHGVRGSTPVPQAAMMHFGGNTACVEVRSKKGTLVILDAGTGIRSLGLSLMKEYGERPIHAAILLSHTHWDHIQGFPFFLPLFDKKNSFHIYGKSRYTKSLEEIMAGQMEHKYFPVSLKEIGSPVQFKMVEEGAFTIGGDVTITAKEHYHPGGAYTYRIEADGATVVYSTDTEHVDGRLDERVVAIAKDADLLIHDTQYDDADIVTHAGWGHSSYRQACEVAKRAGVKRLSLFHYDPVYDDRKVKAILRDAQKLFKNTMAAREGAAVSIG